MPKYTLYDEFQLRAKCRKMTICQWSQLNHLFGA
jgi:hypothetical protein